MWLKNFFIAGPENQYHPPILSYKAFILYGILLLALRFYLGSISVQGAGVESNTLMGLINEERVQRNLVNLRTHSSLVAASSQKSQDMLDRDYFDHIDPDGNYVWNKILSAGYSPYKLLGENLAINFTSSEGMIKAWLDSPSHRANLLHPDFRDQGLTALFGDYNGNYTNITASLFGTLLTQQTPPPPSPPQPPQQPPQPEAPAPPPPVSKPEVPAQDLPVSQTEPEPEAPKTPEGFTPREPAEEDNSTPADLEKPVPSEFQVPEISNIDLDKFALGRVLFSIFGFGLLTVLSIDSYIINKHKTIQGVERSHSSYHLTGFFFIVLVSILIWWW